MHDHGTEGCFVYVLGCATASRYLTYVGWTLDIDRRLAQHNAGTGARSTRGRSWVLLHSERFASRQDAMSREWHLKRDRAFRRRLSEQARGCQHRVPVPDCDSPPDRS
jgi:putative endonuclease